MTAPLHCPGFLRLYRPVSSKNRTNVVEDREANSISSRFLPNGGACYTRAASGVAWTVTWTKCFHVTVRNIPLQTRELPGAIEPLHLGGTLAPRYEQDANRINGGFRDWKVSHEKRRLSNDREKELSLRVCRFDCSSRGQSSRDTSRSPRPGSRHCQEIASRPRPSVRSNHHQIRPDTPGDSRDFPRRRAVNQKRARAHAGAPGLSASASRRRVAHLRACLSISSHVSGPMY